MPGKDETEDRRRRRRSRRRRRRRRKTTSSANGRRAWGEVARSGTSISEVLSGLTAGENSAAIPCFFLPPACHLQAAHAGHVGLCEPRPQGAVRRGREKRVRSMHLVARSSGARGAPAGNGALVWRVAVSSISKGWNRGRCGAETQFRLSLIHI